MFNFGQVPGTFPVMLPSPVHYIHRMFWEIMRYLKQEADHLELWDAPALSSPSFSTLQCIKQYLISFYVMRIRRMQRNGNDLERRNRYGKGHNKPVKRCTKLWSHWCTRMTSSRFTVVVFARERLSICVVLRGSWLRAPAGRAAAIDTLSCWMSRQ